MRYVISKLFVLIRLVLRHSRNLLYNLLFEEFGKGSQVFGRIVCYYPHQISMGNRSTLNEGVILNATKKISIGNHVHISSGCILNTGSLNYKNIVSEKEHISNSIVIEDGVWLASGVIVNPGVRIGKNSVVGAGSVVTKNIPANVLAYGVPAEVRSTLSSEESKKSE